MNTEHESDSISVKKEYLKSLEAENEYLKTEVDRIKEDFERLQSIFEISKNAAKKDNHEVDIELSTVRDQFKSVKEENIYLKEKNETLFKLSKMALDKVNLKEPGEPILEIVEDQDEDGLDALVRSVVDSKSSGFQRINPTAPAENVNNSSNHITNTESHEKVPHKAPTFTNNLREKSQTTRFCHYFSNFGRCKFEEETGRKCKFIHKKAPTCKFDGRCNREKCMFSHTQNRGQPRVQKPSFLKRDYPQWRSPQHPLPPPPAWILQTMCESMVNQSAF